MEIAVLSAEQEAAHTMLHDTVLPLARKRAGSPEDTPAEQLYRDSFEVVLAVINEHVGATDAKTAAALRSTVLDAIDYEAAEDEAAYELSHRLGASLMIHTSRYEDAEKALLHSMAGMTRIHGELSDQVVRVCSTLSTLHEKKGEYKKAVAILGRVLKAQEDSLGHSARMTLNTVSSLAGLLSHIGDLQQAKDLYTRATAGLTTLAREEHGGEEGAEDKDLDLLCCWGNQSILLEKIGEQEEAMSLCKRALRGKVALLGERHAETLRSFNNLACMLESNGENEDAYQMFQKCLEGRKIALGPTNTETIVAQSACANSLLKQGKTKEAVQMYENVVAAFLAEVGANSPLFIKALQELGFARMQNEDLENALSCYKQVTNLKLKVFGAGHPGTLKSFFDTGLLLAQMDDAAAAKKMLNAAKQGYTEAGSRFEAELRKTNMIIEMLEGSGDNNGED